MRTTILMRCAGAALATAGAAVPAFVHGGDGSDATPAGGASPAEVRTGDISSRIRPRPAPSPKPKPTTTTVAPAPTTTAPPPTTEAPVPPRADSVLMLWADDYGVELVFDGRTMFFRRTDDVGSTVAGLDAYGHLESAGWGDLSNPGCLASSGQEYRFPDAPPHAFTWGVYRPITPGVDVVQVVMTDGQVLPVVSQDVGGGLWAWAVERPLGTVDRIEAIAFDTHAIATVDELVADWGSDNC